MIFDPSVALASPVTASALAALSTLSAALALGLPPRSESRLKSRLQAVARERDRLRALRLAALSSCDAKNRLRLKPRGALARLASLYWGGAPDEARQNFADRLKMAGLRGPGPEALFFFARALLPLVFLAAGLIFGLAKDMTTTRVLGTALTGAALGYALPHFILAKLIERRQKAILRAFPDGLDLLLICIHAGMSIEAALTRVTSEIASQSVELAEELSLTMAELSYLPSRWQAYQNLGLRTGLPQVKLIAAALAQAERYGTPISQALAAAARECREARLSAAERKAAALPPKLTVPLVVFFLPVLLGVILAPAALQVSKVWKDRPGVSARPGAPDETPPRSAPASPSPRQGPAD